MEQQNKSIGKGFHPQQSLYVNASSHDKSSEGNDSNDHQDVQVRNPRMSNFNRNNKRQQTLPASQNKSKGRSDSRKDSLAVSVLKKKTVLQLEKQQNSTDTATNLQMKAEQSKQLLDHINKSQILNSQQKNGGNGNRNSENQQNAEQYQQQQQQYFSAKKKTQLKDSSNSIQYGSSDLKREQPQQSNNKILSQKQQLFMQQSYIPDKNYHYYGGNCPYKTIIKVRGLSFQEQQMNDYSPIDILDSHNMAFKLQEEGIQASKRKMAQLTREKLLTFDHIFSESDTNETLYKASFNKVVKQFLQGQNQSIMIHGGTSAGKCHAIFGTLRDPGIMTTILKDLFNEVYEMPECDDIILKVSFLNYDSESGQFYDLQVNTEHPLKIIEDNLSDIHLLGASECIFNNLKTALKLYKTALVNLLGIYQGSEQERDILAKSNFICQIKAELPPKDNLSTETIISKFKIVKFGNQEAQNTENRKKGGQKDDGGEQRENIVSSAVSKILKQLSDQQYKTKKNTLIPYKINPLTEALIDCFQGNSKTYLILCVNNIGKYSYETNHFLRDAIHAKNISTNPQILKISFVAQNLQYGEVKEEVRKTLYLWLMEFGHKEMEDKKKKRQYIIYRQLNKIENAFQNVLPYFESLSLLKTQLNLLYSHILQNYCQAFTKQITCENIQEFYLAKLQNYMVLELESQNRQSVKYCQLLVDEINENKVKIYIGLRQLHKALKIWENKEKKPQFINNYDVEKFISIGKLCRKWLEILEMFANYNHYNASRFNTDFIQIFQKTKQVFIELQQEQENNDYTNLNTIENLDNSSIDINLYTQETIPYSQNQQQQLNSNRGGRQSTNSFLEQDNESDRNSRIVDRPSGFYNSGSVQQKGFNTVHNLENIDIDQGDIQNLANFQPDLDQMNGIQKVKDQDNKDRIERLKERFFLTEQEKMQKKKNEEFMAQEYFYCKNQKIRTGKFQYKSVKKNKRQQQQTMSTENSLEVDDELIKNLFKNDILRMQQGGSQEVKSRKILQKDMKMFSNTASQYYSLARNSLQTNLNVAKPFSPGNDSYQIKQQLNMFKTPQVAQSQKFEISKIFNNNNIAISQQNSRRGINKSQKYDKSSSPQHNQGNPTYLLQQSRKYQRKDHQRAQNQSPKNSTDYAQDYYLPDQIEGGQNSDNENSFSYQNFSKYQRKALAQYQLDEIKNQRLTKLKQQKLPKVIGMEKFKFTLPKIEDSAASDQAMCGKFSIGGGGNSVASKQLQKRGSNVGVK